MFRYLLTSCLCGLLTSSLFAQLQLKLEPLPDWGAWGVYVKPCPDLSPTNNTITGSGQVTIVFPATQSFSDFSANAGTWNVNATVQGPDEAPDKTYVSVGFLIDNPKISYHPSDETLLFRFKLLGNAPELPYLLENGVDPFDQLPNSENTNPGNELSVIDFGVTPTGFYSYTGNYSGNDANCGGTVPQDSTIVTNPQDSTIVTNPQDSTGTGDSTIVTNPQDSTGNTTSVFDFKQTKKVFTVSPNPATDWTSVIFSEAAEMDGVLRLWSIHGAALGALDRGSHEILKLNVEGLSAGLYFLTYEINGKLIQRERLVKQ